jgi:hypothetical protein
LEVAFSKSIRELYPSDFSFQLSLVMLLEVLSFAEYALQCFKDFTSFPYANSDLAGFSWEVKGGSHFIGVTFSF